MLGTGSHPAVFAGLMGNATWAKTPAIVFDASTESMLDVFSHSLLLQFVAGCALGVAIAGVVTMVVDRVSKHQEDDEEEPEQAEDDFWQTSSLDLVKAEAEAGEKDPTSDLGRFRTGQITIDAPTTQTASVKKRSGARHFATAKEGQHVIAADARQAAAAISKNRVGKHSAPATRTVKAVADAQAAEGVYAAKAQGTRRGRHFAQAAAEEKPMKTTERVANASTAPKSQEAERTQKEAGAKAPDGLQPQMSRRERLAALPTIESRSSSVRAPQPMKPVAVAAPNRRADRSMSSQRVVREQNTMDIARPGGEEEPQKVLGAEEKLGITGRIRRQMRGVRDVLAERLSEGALEGVPMIERADGTYVDVEPSWFDQTFVPKLASITGVSHRLDDTTPKMETGTAQRRIETQGGSRAEYISHHVSEVNVGMFPARRSGEELEHEDAWTASMAAINEKLGVNEPVHEFQDMVGGPSTIDDPEGLEPATGMLPYRARYTRTNAMDTETYVDYLLRDEISNNGSTTLSHLPHAHLRVIEGGTGKIATRQQTTATGPHKRPGRHFAAPQEQLSEAL